MGRVRDHGSDLAPVSLDSLVDAVSLVEIVKLLVVHRLSRRVSGIFLVVRLGQALMVEGDDFQLLRLRVDTLLKLIVALLREPPEFWLEWWASLWLLFLLFGGWQSKLSELISKIGKINRLKLFNYGKLAIFILLN